MPELPEVERVRRTLEPALLGRTVTRVSVRRVSVIDGPHDDHALLVGARLAGVLRRGKQLAFTTTNPQGHRHQHPIVSGGTVVGHLGMTGQFLVGDPAPLDTLDHVHVVWTLDSGAALAFRDPRRFGGLWPLPSLDALEARWAALGPDALAVTPAQLAQGLRDSQRACKAALLDQRVLAGVGNIYADEALFQARIAPKRRASRLGPPEIDRLAAAIRTVLQDSIDAGGSTLRDFVDAQGQPGGYRDRHLVYGRGGLPCLTCAAPLRRGVVAQRTTVWCPRCQGPVKRR